MSSSFTTRSYKASPRGFEPLISSLTDWRVLQTTPRGQFFSSVTAAGIEPASGRFRAVCPYQHRPCRIGVVHSGSHGTRTHNGKVTRTCFRDRFLIQPDDFRDFFSDACGIRTQPGPPEKRMASPEAERALMCATCAQLQNNLFVKSLSRLTSSDQCIKKARCLPDTGLREFPIGMLVSAGQDRIQRIGPFGIL